MPEEIMQALLSDLIHWSDKSTYYNNMFSMTTTKKHNGNDGMFSRWFGNSSVKIQGRIYHFIPNTLKSTGLACFTYDAKETLRIKVLEAHAKGKSMKITDKDAVKNKITIQSDLMTQNYLKIVTMTQCKKQ